MPPPSSLPENEAGKAQHRHYPPQPKPIQRKPGGWKSMPYILGNESFERLASIGLTANFTVFLMTVFHMNQVSSSNLINIWSGISNFAPLIGAFISDAYFGKFWVIAFSSFGSLMTMCNTGALGRHPLHSRLIKPKHHPLGRSWGRSWGVRDSHHGVVKALPLHPPSIFSINLKTPSPIHLNSGHYSYKNNLNLQQGNLRSRLSVSSSSSHTDSANHLKLIFMAKNWGWRAVVVFIWFFATTSTTQAIWLDLPDSGTKCVSEDIHNNVVVLADYSVINNQEDSHLHPAATISVKVTSPYGNNLHNKENVTHGQFAFTTSESGNYLACFWVSGNHHAGSRLTVSLDWRVGIAAKDWESVAKKEKIEGMVIFTLIVALPNLHPPPCAQEQALANQCQGPTNRQIGILALALGFLTIGTGGIRPCSLPFGVDQFDPTTDEGRKGITSFFNWYYTTFTIIVLIAITLVVYIQDSVSWVLGFSIPTALMACSIVLFFVGTKMYIYVKPEGSIFSGVAQTLVAAYKKRNIEVEKTMIKGMLYDPPTKGTYEVPKLPLTYQFRYLNKAAIILDGEINPDGSRVSPWKLASIQQVEEVKCLIKVIPIVLSGIICFTSIVQQGTFTVSQALKMDRHLGPHFQIPAGSMGVISMITIGIWLPIYDRIIVPSLRKITKIESGITLLQRIGIGVVFSILSMIVAGMIEKKRRDSANHHNRPDGLAPLSVMWLAPQLILMAFAEAFNILGQLEFYYKEFPDNMKSVGNAMFFVTAGAANYVSSALVTLVHNVTGKHGRLDWLTADINEARVDYFYYVIAGLGVLNLVYYLFVASRYRYKEKIQDNDEDSKLDVELNSLEK